jgi:hypothetical protein
MDDRMNFNLDTATIEELRWVIQVMANNSVLPIHEEKDKHGCNYGQNIAQRLVEGYSVKDLKVTNGRFYTVMYPPKKK